MPQMVDDAGNIWEVDGAGNPVSYVGKQGGQSNTVITKRANPNEQRGDVLKNQLTEAQIQKLIIDMNKPDKEDKPNLPTGYRMKADGSGAELIPGVAAPGSNASGKTDKAGAYNSVIQQIDRLYELYNEGIGTTKGIEGLWDYLPTESNAVFDSAGAALGDQGNAAFKVPGMGSQSDADAARFVAANQPQASDKDGAALEKLRALRQRLENNMAATGLPAPQWNYGLDGKAIDPQQRQETPAGNVPDQSPPLGGGGGDNFNPTGGMALGTGNFATGRDRAVQAQLQAMVKRGASANELRQAVVDSGYAPYFDMSGIQAVVDYRDGTGRYAKQGPQPGAGFQLPTTGQRSGFESGMNSALLSAPGTALTTGVNALGFGALQAMAPEAIQQQRDTNPMSAFAGDVAGVIGGTSVLGKLGQSAASRFAPRLLDGGKWADRARHIAPDAAYGALYGGITEGDPLTGAAQATAGSLGGQIIGKGLQKTFAGGSNTAAQALRDRGIPLTAGQAMGGFGKRMEDAATSVPIIGDIINARRGEGMEAFNRAAFQDAGRPIGATVDDVGDAGIDALRPQISNAYTSATQGVNVPLDAQYAADLAPFIQQGNALPGDYGAGFDRLVQNRVKPALDTGQLSGENFQNMTRAMRDSRGSVQGQPFAQDYIEPVQGMEAATRALMERQGGDRVISGLGRADEAYRNSKVLGKAVEAARNGGRSGEGGIFAPSQLNDASVANARKFGGNGATQNRPFYDLATQGQAVLPSKIGDSGTAARMMAGGGLLAGGTGGAAYLSDDPYKVGAPAGLTAIAALLGTKQGQKLLVKGLLDRPELSKTVGGIFGGRKAKRAIAGGITAPFLIE